MTTIVQDVINRVAVDLQESPAFNVNGIWSVSEIIGYVNYAEVDFQRRTGILKTSVSISLVGVALYLAEFFGVAQFVYHYTAAPGSTLPAGVYPKPFGTMDIERVSYDKRRLYRQSLWDLNRENLNWRNQPDGRPRYYHEDALPINTFEVDRLPASPTSFRLFCDILPPVKSAITDALTIPDTWAQYLSWLCVSLALERDGDGQDMARSRHAFQRYIFGVNLCLRLIRGETQAPVVAVGTEQNG
jgi:hypothetical protein